MTEIKALIRPYMVDKAGHALDDAGFTLTVTADVQAIRQGLHEEDVDYSVELAERFMRVVKLEVVIRDEDAKQVIEVIRDHARTGRKGDGLIYVSDVRDAIHVRTGERGGGAVPPFRDES